MATPSRFTLNDLRLARSAGPPRAMLTCYDYTTATLLEQAGVPLILVGDSASNVILGHASTLPVTLSFMIEITAAVKRGTSRALVIGDMPFGSYHASESQAIRNVAKMIKRSHCDAVKIEAGHTQVELVSKLADAGVAIIAHLGLRPQAVGLMGGYRYQGRTVREAQQIVDLAVQFSQAGAAAILLEAVPPEVSERVVDHVAVPVIGCGAGPACHAHVVVLQDLLHQTPHRAKFVPSTPPAGSLIETAKRFVMEVESRAYPSQAHCYEMPPDEKAKFLSSGVVV
ncbi:MAG TPA: 3-methyl-2-oxobutanoate hydroxymethyltransferase [Tepidisphaeraceae bacterium]